MQLGPSLDLVGCRRPPPHAPTGRVEDWRGTRKPVSSPRLVKRSMRISRTTLALLWVKVSAMRESAHYLHPSRRKATSMDRGSLAMADGGFGGGKN